MTWPTDTTNLVARCRELARTRGDQRAYLWLRDGESEERELRYAELDAAARAVGAELEARGLAGRRALLLYSAGLDFVVAFLGCLYARVIAVPLSAPRNELGLETVLGIARHAAPAALLADRWVLANLQAWCAPLSGLMLLATDELPRERGQGWRPGTIEPEALACLQYTSGSTSAPKGVEVRHGNLMANEAMIAAAFGHDEHTVFVGWLPLFHDMGLVGNVLQPLYLGVPSILMAPAAFVQHPARWLRAISRYRATTSGGPNFGYELCAQKVKPEEVSRLDLSSWRVAYNGSEPVRAATLARFHERFAPAGFRAEALYPCYGLAEAALFVTGGVAGVPARLLDVDATALQAHRVRSVAPGDPAARRLVSCGRPWLDQRVLVVDPETRVELAERAVGELWIQGSNVARGYRNSGEAEDPFRAFLADGRGPFLRTGDLGFLEGGELFVTGRRKDVLILRGQNVYPQDIELVAGTSHPAFRLDHTAAFTIEEDGEERLVVVQELTRSARTALGVPPTAASLTALGETLRQAVARRFGWQVWHIALLEPGCLPKTTSGKVQRQRCRALWSRGELHELGHAAAPVSSPTHST